MVRESERYTVRAGSEGVRESVGYIIRQGGEGVGESYCLRVRKSGCHSAILSGQGERE